MKLASGDLIAIEAKFTTNKILQPVSLTYKSEAVQIFFLQVISTVKYLHMNIKSFQVSEHISFS